MNAEWPPESRKTGRREPDGLAERTRTLGELLYADPGKRRIPEEEWVALVQSIAAGDRQALHALYERAHKAAFTLILRITQSRESAEELTVDVFHDVWRRASSYDAAGGSVLGWILNQARSRAIDRLRFDSRKKRQHPGTEAPTPEIDPHPEQVLVLKQQGRHLREALKLLTADERVAIETAYFSELTYTEVAARLNQPLGTIKTRIRSGLGKLRQSLTSRVKES